MTVERARITVFDTTLRDGEQSPGCSMNQQEKLRLAHQLDRLGEGSIGLLCVAAGVEVALPLPEGPVCHGLLFN